LVVVNSAQRFIIESTSRRDAMQTFRNEFLDMILATTIFVGVGFLSYLF